LASVRRQVARNCWNAGIKFCIGSYVKSTNSYKLTNHWGTKDDERVVIIASPDVTTLLLEEDNKKMSSELGYTGKYWLFLDEPTVGADIMGSKYLESNIKVILNMPKWTILSSATMPVPEKITEIISYHRSRFPDVFISTQITKEISIGCDAITFENDTVVPHIGCKNQQEIKTCIAKINEVPFLGRLYTFKVAEQLWKDFKANGINDIENIEEYFSNVDNLSSDKVRIVCISMLNKLSEQKDAKIKKICASKIFADEIKVKQAEDSDDDGTGIVFVDEDEPSLDDLVINHVDFTRFGTTEAAKYLNMNLIVSLDPINTAKTSFSALLDDIQKSGIDITRLRNYIGNYQSKVEEYHKQREYLAKTLKVTKGDEKQGGERKELHFESEAKKRGCGQDDLPTLEFPLTYQINTLNHWKKYGSHYIINPSNLRAGINITNLPLAEFEIEDWLAFLLFCGVGVYSPYQIKDPVYLREVLNLAESGKLAYLVSDSSICYGTNYPINRVFITKEFADTHSINTIFQLMGRAGRAGQSWKAEVYMENSIAKKLINFVQKDNDDSGDLEAKNMTETFKTMYYDQNKKFEDKKKKEQEYEQKLIDDALNAMKKSEEVARLKKLQKEKESIESKTIQTSKVVTVQEVIKPTEQKQFDKYEKKVYVTAKKYVSSESNDKWNKIGTWRNNTEKSHSQPTSSSTDGVKYIPPWKRNAQEQANTATPVQANQSSGSSSSSSSSMFSSFSDYKQRSQNKKPENKDSSSNNLSWRK
jgi:hypothetical protein